MSHDFAAAYTGRHAERILYPLGGLGTGGMCLSGTGALEAVALRHRAAMYHKPFQFASICIPDMADGARVLEGPVPEWKPLFPWGSGFHDSGGGARNSTFGFPRFDHSQFTDRFPFAEVELRDGALPLTVVLTAWSPFIPGDADASSQPLIVLEYAITNTSNESITAVVGYHSANHLQVADSGAAIEPRPDGFVLQQAAVDHAHQAGALRVACDAKQVAVDTGWLRAGWWDAATRLWSDIAAGAQHQRDHQQEDPNSPMSPGASVTTQLTLAPGARTTVRFRMSWLVPHSDVYADNANTACCPTSHQPRYSAWYQHVDEVDTAAAAHLSTWRSRTAECANLLAHNSLPAVIREAVSANLGILRSPTVMRQRDGRLWMWEGCFDDGGCCSGSCTHVWNWAQATAHLFPELERGLRETEHGPGQMPDGGQRFRIPLPIAEVDSRWWTAVDGQLGGIIKTYRDWRLSGDDDWLRHLLPALLDSLEYIITTFDPDRSGVLRGAQHNTYDIEFYGPNGMLMTCYLAALVAMDSICQHLDSDPNDYAVLADRCRSYLEQELFDGRSYIQQVRVDPDAGEHLKPMCADSGSRELTAIVAAEGPSYQYATGVLTTTMLGEWLAETAGLQTNLKRDQVRQCLHAMITHNLKRDLRRHANPQRPGYAFGDEAGLLVCTWPDNDAPTLPFPYCSEAWPSLEYQTAAHLLRHGDIDQALDLVAIARARYSGLRRNPFDEIECGHWYGRSLASYDLLAAWSGVRYDAVSQTMHVAPVVGGDLDLPFINGSAWGMLEVRAGSVRYRPIAGSLTITSWVISLPDQSDAANQASMR